MTESFTPYPLVYSKIKQGGVPVSASTGFMPGGALLQNPLTAADQGLMASQVLQVDLINNQGLMQDSASLNPGDFYQVPPGFEGTIWVKSEWTGHMFSGVVMFAYVPFVPFTSNWPPSTFTTLTQVIGSYLYQEYNDDEDLQVFVNAYNSMAQAYVTWFTQVMLPVYAKNQMVTGDLLDWVALGLYGMRRPTLASGLRIEIGPFNTAMFNEEMFNEDILLDPTDVFSTDDDTFKRILTWHLEKGDGKIFNIRWLKRRIMRFLTGSEGSLGQSAGGDPSTADMYPPDQTYFVSVTWGAEDQVNINFQSVHRSITGGAMFNSGMFNEFEFNELGTSVTYSITSPWAPIFKAAVESGALELPFQYTWVVNIS